MILPLNPLILPLNPLILPLNPILTFHRSCRSYDWMNTQ
jgi:hypothetical protein